MEPGPASGADRHDVDLVLGGGGVRGVAFAGAIAALEDAGYTIRRAAGVSAGAIAGALAVAGVPAVRMRSLARELDYRAFALSDLIAGLQVPGPLGAVADRLGLGGGPAPDDWLWSVLAEHGIETFGDLRTDDPDSGLPPERRYRLTVSCLDVSNRRVVRLPWDASLYDVDPDDLEVTTAVRASMSIPFVYDPVILGSGDQAGSLLDGGLVTHFPVSVFDRRDGRPPRWPTFAVRLLPGRDPVEGAITTNRALLRALVETLLSSTDELASDRPCDRDRTITVDTLGVRALQLGIDDETDDALYANGYDAVERFLSSWDHDTYVERCRGGR